MKILSGSLYPFFKSISDRPRRVHSRQLCLSSRPSYLIAECCHFFEGRDNCLLRQVCHYRYKVFKINSLVIVCADGAQKTSSEEVRVGARAAIKKVGYGWGYNF